MRLKIKLLKRRINNFIMSQWQKWVRTTLIILLLEIITVTSIINYTLLKQTSITTVYIAQANQGTFGENEKYPAKELIESHDSTLSENSQTASSSITALIEQTFPEEPEVAIKLAYAESGLKSDNESWCDKTADGYSFSIGLMQLNINQHKIGNLDCPSAFKGTNYKAIVINEKLYNECVKLAKDPSENLKVARKIYDGRGWTAWGAFNNAIKNNIPTK